MKNIKDLLPSNLNDKGLDITLVQPNKVTNARYDFDEREENILTLMIEAIQMHMTQEKEIQRDLFNEPFIQLELESPQEKQKYLLSLDKMKNKSVSFEWKNEDYQYGTKTTAVLVTAYHDHKNTRKIDITINKWAIPYLLFWGKGVGGTIFNKRIALTLRGKYTKRIYKLCKRWENKGGFVMPLDDFKVMLNLPNSYNKSKIERRLLIESREELRRVADVYFEYSITKENGSRSFNTINFKIFPNPKNIKNKEKAITGKLLAEKGDTYTFVYRVVSIAFPPIKDSKAFDILEQLSKDENKLRKAHDRFKRMEREEQKNWSELIPLIKYILDKDYGLK